ncbi:MAG: HDIG domain-containing protein [Bacteroidetes bacterium]|nr:HDIG domain-containing protein [Bacteroidota bacterium]
MNRDEALELLHEYTRSDSLRKHALGVEAAMRAYARKHGEDEEVWGVVGLLHDFDYEKYPEYPDHPTRGNEILKEKGLPEELRNTILSHVPAMNIPRETRMARTLFACDELSGFIVACALVRPNKIADLKVSSVKKKLKDKAFARAVSREDIYAGAEEAGLELGEHIGFVIGAMQAVSKELDLA